MRKLLDKIPIAVLGPLALFMAVLPVVPEPHLLEKLRMLSEGTLSRPIDIFDLFWHSWLLLLLALKLLVMALSRKSDQTQS